MKRNKRTKRRTRSIIVPILLAVLIAIVVIVPLATLVKEDNSARNKSDNDTGVSDTTQNHTQCKHTAENRGCWTDGFDINTDFEIKTPDTGRTREVSTLWLVPSASAMLTPSSIIS
jgi:hypothetical protein